LAIEAFLTIERDVSKELSLRAGRLSSGPQERPIASG
jgi:hypothetical protein